MFTGWTMDASSTASLPLLGQGLVGAPGYALRIYASGAWKHVTLTPTHEKPLQTTETCGSSKYHQDWKLETEAAIVDKSDKRRARRITCHQQDHPAQQPASVFICQGRRRDSKSRISWPLQQHKTMFLNKSARRYSIVEFDWRVPTTA